MLEWLDLDEIAAAIGYGLLIAIPIILAGWVIAQILWATGVRL